MSIVEQHNKELRKLYEKASGDILDKVNAYNEKNPKDKIAFPLFLKSVEKYEHSKTKIMIFGQETNSWYGTYGKDTSAEHIMNCYEEFLTDGLPYHKGFFCKGVREFMKLWENNTGKEVGYLWNNIVKIGYADKNAGKAGFPRKFYEDIVKPNMNGIIVEEIKILKPDYIVFLTGPRYYHIVNDVFGTPKRELVRGFKANELCEIIIPNEKIPSVKRAFRTYHPGYLQRRSKAVRENYFSKIIEEITQNLNNKGGTK